MNPSIFSGKRNRRTELSCFQIQGYRTIICIGTLHVDALHRMTPQAFQCGTHPRSTRVVLQLVSLFGFLVDCDDKVSKSLNPTAGPGAVGLCFILCLEVKDICVKNQKSKSNGKVSFPPLYITLMTS